MRLRRRPFWFLVIFCLTAGICDIILKFNSQIDFPSAANIDTYYQWGPLNNLVLGKEVKTGKGLSYLYADSPKVGRGALNIARRTEDIHRGKTSLIEKLRHRNQTEPQSHIAFLKVHMAGSSPVQTMLYRYGYSQNLSFVLPSKGHYFTKSTDRPEPILPPKYGTHFDVVCNHACFNYSLYSSLMPSDTVYIAIVRDPYKQFLYSYHYYLRFFSFDYLKKIPYPPLENLILNPDKYDEGCLSYTMNAMARDFGFQKEHFDQYSLGSQDTIAHDYLNEIADAFDFVLVYERYEESLILMRRLFNWPLKSILFIPEKEDVSEMPLSDDLLEQFKNRNRLDYLIYDYFADEIDETIRAADEDLLDETLNFKMALKTVRMWCDYQYFGTLTIPATKWNERFEVTSNDCDLMGKSEFQFMDLLKAQ